MPIQDPDRPYTQRDVRNMLQERLPGGNYNWIRDPEGNPAVQAYGSSHLPAQLVYVNYRPSVGEVVGKDHAAAALPVRENSLYPVSLTAATVGYFAAGAVPQPLGSRVYPATAWGNRL